MPMHKTDTNTFCYTQLKCALTVDLTTVARGRRRRQGITAATGGLLGLALASLDAIFAHGQGTVHSVQLEVQSTRVTYRLSLIVSSPESRGLSPAIGAA